MRNRGNSSTDNSHDSSRNRRQKSTRRSNDWKQQQQLEEEYESARNGNVNKHMSRVGDNWSYAQSSPLAVIRALAT